MISMLRRLKAENIKSNFIIYLFKTMVRPLYMYANAARANATKTDLSKIHTEQNKAIRLAYHLATWSGRTQMNYIKEKT